MLHDNHHGKFGHVQPYGKLLRWGALCVARKHRHLWCGLHQRLLFRHDVRAHIVIVFFPVLFHFKCHFKRRLLR